MANNNHQDDLKNGKGTRVYIYLVKSSVWLTVLCVLALVIVSLGTELGWVIHWRVFNCLSSLASIFAGSITFSLKQIIKHKDKAGENRHIETMAELGLKKTLFGYKERNRMPSNSNREHLSDSLNKNDKIPTDKKSGKMVK